MSCPNTCFHRCTSERRTITLLSLLPFFLPPLSPLNIAAFMRGGALNCPSVRGEQDNPLLLPGSLSASVAGEPGVVSFHPVWGKEEKGSRRIARGKCGGLLLWTALTTEPSHLCVCVYMQLKAAKAGTEFSSVCLFPVWQTTACSVYCVERDRSFSE